MSFEAITTQEQFDAVIKDRLDRERSKFEGYDDFKEKAGKYDELKTKADGYEQTIAAMKLEIDGDDKNPGYKKQIADLQEKVKVYETSSVKMRIAHENGIPYELAGRLSGDNEDAIKKDAESLAKLIKASKPTAPLANPDPTKIDTKKAAMKKMLEGLGGE